MAPVHIMLNINIIKISYIVILFIDNFIDINWKYPKQNFHFGLDIGVDIFMLL